LFARIIGIGSPFGLDRIGIDAIDQLKSTSIAQRIELITLDRPGLSLVDYFDVDSLLIVDAVISDGLVGETSCIDIHALEKNSKNLSTHNAGIVDAIALARSLNMMPAKLQILGINIGTDSISTDSESEIPPEWIKEAKDKIIELIGKE